MPAFILLLLCSFPALAQPHEDTSLNTVLVLLVLVLLLSVYLLWQRYQLRQLRQQAPAAAGFYFMHDDISGFPNKFALQQHLQQLLSRAPDRQFALIVFKITGFEHINQLLGHSNSNLILAQIAQRLNNQLQQEEGILTFEYRQQLPIRVSHLGGVDFAIWFDDNGKHSRALYLAEQLERSVPEAMLVHGCAIDYQLVSGIALYPLHGTQLNELLERAYLALQHHQWQRANSPLFEPSMLNYTAEKLAFMAQLRQAITEQQLQLFVQPQIHITTGQVVAAEVLIRWRHPQRGLLEADDFIHLAEEMGVIYPLHRWVFTEAMQTIVALTQANLVSKVAVNLSSKELLQDELVEELALMFEQYQVAPQQLVLELKESALLAEPERAGIILQRLHRLGVSLALDDFGTGFSSLGYLRQLPIQAVKIDCSFISELDKSDMQSAITGAIIDMARNLGLSVVAEGIETADVEDKLLRMGCQFGQGYWYSKPFELAGFPSWLAQWQQKSKARHPQR